MLHTMIYISLSLFYNNALLQSGLRKIQLLESSFFFKYKNIINFYTNIQTLNKWNGFFFSKSFFSQDLYKYVHVDTYII